MNKLLLEKYGVNDVLQKESEKICRSFIDNVFKTCAPTVIRGLNALKGSYTVKFMGKPLEVNYTVFMFSSTEVLDEFRKNYSDLTGSHYNQTRHSLNVTTIFYVDGYNRIRTIPALFQEPITHELSHAFDTLMHKSGEIMSMKWHDLYINTTAMIDNFPDDYGQELAYALYCSFRTEYNAMLQQSIKDISCARPEYMQEVWSHSQIMRALNHINWGLKNCCTFQAEIYIQIGLHITPNRYAKILEAAKKKIEKEIRRVKKKYGMF